MNVAESTPHLPRLTSPFAQLLESFYRTARFAAFLFCVPFRFPVQNFESSTPCLRVIRHRHAITAAMRCSFSQCRNLKAKLSLSQCRSSNECTRQTIKRVEHASQFHFDGSLWNQLNTIPCTWPTFSFMPKTRAAVTTYSRQTPPSIKTLVLRFLHDRLVHVPRPGTRPLSR